MPTYEYKCRRCGNEFEESQRITAKPVAKCPRCGAKAQRQLSGGAGLVFKGSGFYLTDYGRSGQKKADAREGVEKAEGAAKGDKPAKPDAPASASKAPTKQKDD